MKFVKKSLEGLLLIASLTSSSEADKRPYEPQPVASQAYGHTEVYPSRMQMLDGKPVVERNKYLIGENIRGLCHTYSGLIEILEGLRGSDREKVVEHEVGHRENPMRSEEENRRKTYTEEPNINGMVSCVG